MSIFPIHIGMFKTEYNNPQTINLEGLDVYEIWGLVKTSETVIDYPIRVQPQTEVGGDYAVFWDANNKISADSPISLLNGTTATGNTLNSLTVGNDYISVTEIIGHIEGIIQTRTDSLGDDGVIYTSGDYVTLNSKLGIQMITQCRFDSGVLNVIDGGNSWSLTTFASDLSNVGTLDIFCTSTTRGRNFRQEFNSTPTLEFAQYHNSSNVVYNIYHDSQYLTSDSKIMNVTLDSSEMKGYYNGTLEDTVAISGTYYNDNIRFFGKHGAGDTFRGIWQLTAIHDSTINQTQVNTINTELTNIYNL